MRFIIVHVPQINGNIQTWNDSTRECYLKSMYYARCTIHTYECTHICIEWNSYSTNNNTTTSTLLIQFM